MGDDKFGREPVRAISDPHSGSILTGRCNALNDNFHGNFTTLGSPPREDAAIEGIIIKGDDDNTSIVWLCTPGEDVHTGYPLVAGQAVSIAIDRLSKIVLYIELSGEIAHYLSMRRAT